MRDGPLRHGIKALVRLCYLADLVVVRAWLGFRGQDLYRLEGHCTACGGCCVEPAIVVPWVVVRLASLRWLVLAWQRWINGLRYVRTRKNPHTLVFRCTHYDPLTRRCDSYAARPGMCRDYPRLLLHSAIPELLDGCGYRAVHRRADHVTAALAQLDLSDEAIADLRQRLNLDEPTSD